MSRTQDQLSINRFETVMAIRRFVLSGRNIECACRDCDICLATFKRWSYRYDTFGIKGLRDMPRSGRPSKSVKQVSE
jgi:transposase